MFVVFDSLQVGLQCFRGRVKASVLQRIVSAFFLVKSFPKKYLYHIHNRPFMMKFIVSCKLRFVNPFRQFYNTVACHFSIALVNLKYQYINLRNVIFEKCFIFNKFTLHTAKLIFKKKFL